MRTAEKFTQKDAITTVTNIREAQESAKTARATADAMADVKVKQQLTTLAAKYDEDARYLADGLFRRLAARLVNDDRSKLLKLVTENIEVFPAAE